MSPSWTGYRISTASLLQLVLAFFFLFTFASWCPICSLVTGFLTLAGFLPVPNALLTAKIPRRERKFSVRCRSIDSLGCRRH
ncbi:hypothetical protein F5Y01DRAFT_288964 [Xylaria sp. FL0043]|nr:hypothetical protein F5Y01DRAFT_288964 [Xylaria sp. FL0043]